MLRPSPSLIRELALYVRQLWLATCLHGKWSQNLVRRMVWGRNGTRCRLQVKIEKQQPTDKVPSKRPLTHVASKITRPAIVVE